MSPLRQSLLLARLRKIGAYGKSAVVLGRSRENERLIILLTRGWLARSAGRGLRVTPGYDQNLDRWLTTT